MSVYRRSSKGRCRYFCKYGRLFFFRVRCGDRTVLRRFFRGVFLGLGRVLVCFIRSFYIFLESEVNVFIFGVGNTVVCRGFNYSRKLV